MSPYRLADRWLLADGLLHAAIEELAIDGRRGREGVAFLLGRHHDRDGHITHLVVLRGDRLVKTVNHLQVPAAMMNEVTDIVIAQGGVLLGQIHSHGPGYGVDLSYADHQFGIRAPGFLSLVAPDFGMRLGTRLQDCGVHVFEEPGGFRRMAKTEIRARFADLVGTRVTVLVAKL